MRVQKRMWQEHGIPVAFTVLKHHLDWVRAELDAEQYIHIGDTNMDRHYAERNGFAYFYPDDGVDHLWEPPATAWPIRCWRWVTRVNGRGGG